MVGKENDIFVFFPSTLDKIRNGSFWENEFDFLSFDDPEVVDVLMLTIVMPQ